MSSGLLVGIRNLFSGDHPRWACEFTRDSVVVVSASPDRSRVATSASAPLPEGAITPGYRDGNIVDPAAVGSALGRALGEAGFAGSELTVVIPDDAVKVSLIETQSFPSSEAERQTFIRWKLKKHVPFDVATSAVAYQTLGENGVVDILAVLSPESVTRQYESVVDGLGLHPGIVTPSTVATLNLLDGDAASDALFVKAAGPSVVTAIVASGRLRFYRNVAPSGSIESSIHPTLMYYQDKIAGADSPGGLTRMVLCCDSPAGAADARVAADGMGLDVVPLYSAGLDDMFKPAFGALRR